MKKFILMLTLCSLKAVSQNRVPYSILNPDGPISFFYTSKGCAALEFTSSQWDKIVAGTKYSSNRLSNVNYKRVVIEIADQQFGQCKRGIGFGCSIFDDLFLKQYHPVLVNHSNRFASAMIKRKGSQMVLLIFIDTINWESLQRNQ